MKTTKLIKKILEAAVNHDSKKQAELYQKLLDKSLKNKYTYAVK